MQFSGRACPPEARQGRSMEDANVVSSPPAASGSGTHGSPYGRLEVLAALALPTAYQAATNATRAHAHVPAAPIHAAVSALTASISSPFCCPVSLPRSCGGRWGEASTASGALQGLLPALQASGGQARPSNGAAVSPPLPLLLLPPRSPRPLR